MLTYAILIFHWTCFSINIWFVIFLHLGDEEWTSSNKVPAASLRSLLTHFLDISSPPTQPLLQSLVASITDKQKVGELISLAAQVGLRCSADDAKNPGLTDQWHMVDTGIYVYVFSAHGYISPSLRSRLVLPIPDDQYISTIIENDLSVRFHYHFLLGRRILKSEYTMFFM